MLIVWDLLQEKNENGCSASKVGPRKRPRISDASSGSAPAEERSSRRSASVSQLPSPVLVDKVAVLAVFILFLMIACTALLLC